MVNRQAFQILGVVLGSYLLIILDISIVITGLPDIQAGLGFSAVALSWVQNAYLLCFGGFLLLGARAGDLLGRRRLLLVGLGVFTFASLMVGLANTPEWLIVARAVQGVAAAVIAPSVLALIATHFAEGAERTKALAYYSMVAGAGSALGLVMGGYFAGEISWRVGFLMNVPIGILLMIAALRVIPETNRHRGGFDIPGATTSTAGMISLVYGIVSSANFGWHSADVLGPIVLGVILLVLFVIIEAHSPRPIMPLHLFASRQRTGAYVARMLFLGAMVSFFYFTTQLLQRVMGYSPFQAGMAFLPFSAMTFWAAMNVPQLTERLGNGRLLSLALTLTAAGMFWLAQADSQANFILNVALPMIVIGLGNGAALGPLTVAGVAGVEAKDHGAASGVVNAFHQLGGSLGLAVLVVVFAASGSASLQTGIPLLSKQIETALLGASALLGLSLITALALVAPSDKLRIKS